MILGRTTRKLECAICKLEIRVGDLAFFDSTKTQGSHMAHQGCWNALKASRAARGIEAIRKPKAKVQSKEHLDPPF